MDRKRWVSHAGVAYAGKVGSEIAKVLLLPMGRVEQKMKRIGDPDWAIRAKAFEVLEHLALEFNGRIPWDRINAGFEFQGENIKFASRALGIFKPRQMSAALSVKTVVPRAGRDIWYQDQEKAFDFDSGLLSYDLAKGRLDSGANAQLRLAYERKAPIIYFRGVESGVYDAVCPVWIEHFDTTERRVLLAAPDVVRSNVSSVEAFPTSQIEVREASWTVAQSKRRNHQAWFSSVVKSAYGYRCAFSGLPLRNLLVGAHIIPDAEAGPVAVTNGICMSTLHHSAFDSYLIGVDPDYRVHVARNVLEERDGPILESLKGLDRQKLRLPVNEAERPSQTYLEQRFKQFEKLATT